MHAGERRGWLRELCSAAALATVLLSIACTENHTDIAQPVANDPNVTGIFPPVPMITGARIGDTEVTLFWLVDDDSNVGSYRLYRRIGSQPERKLPDVITETEFTDTQLTNGVTYTYRVAAVLRNHLEGDPSEPIQVTPNLYAVLIANGAAYTNRETVSLTVSAPASTSSMRFAETAVLDALPWRPYSPAPTLELTPGDGVKTVYVQFRDAAGNETDVYSDDIVLDTQAEIAIVDHDAGPGQVPSGTVIHFRLDAGEPGGVATIAIGDVQSGIELFDDGAHGDGAAQDGDYGRDFTVPLGSEVLAGAVVGNFRDAAGNAAEPRTADTPITINDPPTPVTLAQPFDIGSTSLHLSWSQSPDADFLAYRVYRALTAGVLSDPGRVLVAEIADRNETTLADEGLQSGETYFYVVQTLDRFGGSSPSNVTSGTTTP